MKKFFALIAVAALVSPVAFAKDEAKKKPMAPATSGATDEHGHGEGHGHGHGEAKPKTEKK